MTYDMRAAAALLGRLLIAALFILEGVGKARDYAGAAAYMDAFGVPALLLPPVILLEIGGGFLIAVGLYARPIAVLFAAFCVAAAILFHNKIGAPGQLLHLEKDLAIAGGFLVLAAFGPGAWSIDAAWQRQLPRRITQPGSI